MKIIELFATLIGWSTLYHVAWTETERPPSFRSGDMTITIVPWITGDNWSGVRNGIAKQNDIDPLQMIVLSVTKL